MSGTFPPLLGNPTSADAAYVAEVIRDGLSGPLEVEGVSYDGMMPAVPALDGADLEAVVAYVGILADGSAETDEVGAEAPVLGDADRGHEYFRGSRRFDEGGAACASCHTAGADGNLGGSGLGPDLTLAYETLGGEVGLTGWLSNPPSATMSPIFAERPMNDAEVADVVAYLGSTPGVERNDPAVDRLLLAGLAGLVVLFGGMGIAWQGMRQTYVERLRSQR